jgi:SpoVK/Ycf46/Vps4 family AAA+-type ATPase
MSILQSIVASATNSLSDALTAISRREFNACRDHCMRADAYVELLLASASRHQIDEAIDVADKSIKEIISDLHTLAHHLTKPIDKIDSSPLPIHIDPLKDDNHPEQVECAESAIISRSLSDVLGNVKAKNALYEAIVLPFSMDKANQSKIFCGIRRLCSNVLLYGPPGCGKILP